MIVIIFIIITITWTVLDNSPGKMGLSDRSGGELESIRSVGNWAYLHLHHQEIWVWSPRWQHTIDHHRSPSWLKDTVAPEVLLASHVEARTPRTPGPWGTARFLRYHQCSSSERGVSPWLWRPMVQHHQVISSFYQGWYIYIYISHIRIHPPFNPGIFGG